jgi:cytochrome c peroxidase
MNRAPTFTLTLLATVAGAGCGAQADKLFCSGPSCESSEEWEAIAALAGLPESPAPDRSNRFFHDPAAEKLGQKFFFDARFSGSSLATDAIKRPVTYARAPKGQPANVSCASCHNTARAAIDTESVPGNVSVGAAWTDTNSPTLFNAAFYDIVYWIGRCDNLWAQAVGSNEGASSNGTRLQTAWVLQDHYAAEYAAVTGKAPLPAGTTSASVRMLVEANGQCKLAPGCPEGCRSVRAETGDAMGCFPRFPLQGKPGKAGCQPGDPSEPFGDAFDCMAAEDRDYVTDMLVNFAKIEAAYEYRLVSRDSTFDRFVASVRAGADEEQALAATKFSAAARRGAGLFVGKAACVECHNSALLSDSKFHNIGVPQVGPGIITEADCPAGGVCDCVGTAEHGPTNCLPWGARDGLDKLHKSAYRRDSVWSDDPTDVSRKPYMEIPFAASTLPRVAGVDLDFDGGVRKGAYRTPTLRDVALTAPYMHNGLFRTLEEVVAHYNGGGSSNTVGSRSPQVKRLYLAASEQADLVEFLKALTGAPLPAELVATPVLPP